MARFYVGTSGWHYEDWVGPFYPSGTAAEDYLEHYARDFRAVELNNTFYSLPKKRTASTWCEQTPKSFTFACKASRFITHMKKLKDPHASTQRFFAAVEPLGAKLGPILFQLPPHWHANADRLRAFLDALPRQHRYVFEFRDRSWFADEILEILAGHGAACCAFDIDGERSPIELTADFAYVRLHGPGERYRGSYDGRTLRGWVRRFERWHDDGRDVFCFFDNDQKGCAPRDALRLRDMLH